jgi:hypothetical protein
MSSESVIRAFAVGSVVWINGILVSATGVASSEPIASEYRSVNAGAIPHREDWAPASAQDGVIVGQIVAVDGRAIVGAQVSIARTNFSAATDTLGQYVLRHTASGTQTIELKHPDYQLPTLPAIRLPEKDTLRFNAMLQRPLPPGRAADSALRVARLVNGVPGNPTVPMVVIDGSLVVFQATSRGFRQISATTLIDIAVIEYFTAEHAMKAFRPMFGSGVLQVYTTKMCPRQGQKHPSCG